MAKKNNKTETPAAPLTPAQALAELQAKMAAMQAEIAAAEKQAAELADASRAEREQKIRELPQALGVDSLAVVKSMVDAMVKHDSLKPSGKSLKDGERKERTSLPWSKVKEACEKRAAGAQWSVLHPLYDVSQSFFNARLTTLGFTCASVQADQPIPAKLVKALDEEIAKEAQKAEGVTA